jgi:NADH:ubiquinone oxidoreductase subunit 4 (subunit M)
MLTKILQFLVGALVALFSMATCILPGMKAMVGSILVIGGLRNMVSPETAFYGIGILVGVAAPYVLRYAAKTYVWAHAKWAGYTSDAEGRIVIDAVGIVVS